MIFLEPDYFVLEITIALAIIFCAAVISAIIGLSIKFKSYSIEPWNKVPEYQQYMADLKKFNEEGTK